MRTVTEAMDDFQRITEEWINWSWRLEALVLANPVECRCWTDNGRNGSQGHIGACEEWRQVASAIRTKSKMVAGPASTPPAPRPGEQEADGPPPHPGPPGPIDPPVPPKHRPVS